MNRLRGVAIFIFMAILAACGVANPDASTTATADQVTAVAVLPSLTPSDAAITTGPPASPTLVPTSQATPTGTATASPTTAPTIAPTASATSTQAATATASPTTAPTEPATPTETPAASTATAVAAETALPQGEEGVAVRTDLAGKLAVVRGQDTWLYRPRTGEVRRLLAGTTDARWSPDGRAIAFAREDGLYVADGEGANERQIYAGDRVHTPVWAPDSAKIAFEQGTVADSPAEREVWVVELPSNEARRVAQGADPAWAPDSKRIAYVTLPVGDGLRRAQLRLVSWLGQNDWPVVRDLPPNIPPIGIPGSQSERAGLEHVMEHPFWDAEGRYIYVPSFVLYQALAGFSIWERADATDGGSTFLGELPEVFDATPAPGRQAALFSVSSARGDSWFVARAIGGEDTDWRWAETPNGISAIAPAWAPDARAVAYYRCELEQPEQCSLELLTPQGGAQLIPDVFGGTAPDRSRPLVLDWARDE